eukprot:Skav226933  [mRNA]  locus=scaffold965:97989:98255:- [translate_table: standard]
MDSSYNTWKWGEGFAKGMPCPPSRRMHDRHLQKLENFMKEVKDWPVMLSIQVQLRRGTVKKDKFEDSEQSVYEACDPIDLRTLTIASL